MTKKVECVVNQKGMYFMVDGKLQEAKLGDIVKVSESRVNSLLGRKMFVAVKPATKAEK